MHREFDVSNKSTCSVWLDTLEFNNNTLRDYLAKKAFLFRLYYSFLAYFSVFNIGKLMLKNTGPNLDHSSIFSPKIDYKTMRYIPWSSSYELPGSSIIVSLILTE